MIIRDYTCLHNIKTMLSSNFLYINPALWKYGSNYRLYFSAEKAESGVIMMMLMFENENSNSTEDNAYTNDAYQFLIIISIIIVNVCQ